MRGPDTLDSAALVPRWSRYRFVLGRGRELALPVLAKSNRVNLNPLRKLRSNGPKTDGFGQKTSTYATLHGRREINILVKNLPCNLARLIEIFAAICLLLSGCIRLWLTRKQRRFLDSTY